MKLREGTVETGRSYGKLPSLELSSSQLSPGAACTAAQDGIGPGTLHPKAPELGGGASGEWTVPRGVLG